VDGNLCTFTNGGGSCGSTNLGVALMASSTLDKTRSNYYNYQFTTSGPQANLYHVDNLGNPPMLRIFPSGGIAVAGAHTVAYTLTPFSSGSLGTGVSTSYKFNVVAPATFTPNPRARFRSFPAMQPTCSRWRIWERAGAAPIRVPDR
jgi:hypothetical protein